MGASGTETGSAEARGGGARVPPDLAAHPTQSAHREHTEPHRGRRQSSRGRKEERDMHTQGQRRVTVMSPGNEDTPEDERRTRAGRNSGRRARCHARQRRPSRAEVATARGKRVDFTEWKLRPSGQLLLKVTRPPVLQVPRTPTGPSLGQPKPPEGILWAEGSRYQAETPIGMKCARRASRGVQ